MQYLVGSFHLGVTSSVLFTVSPQIFLMSSFPWSTLNVPCGITHQCICNTSLVIDNTVIHVNFVCENFVQEIFMQLFSSILTKMCLKYMSVLIGTKVY